MSNHSGRQSRRAFLAFAAGSAWTASSQTRVAGSNSAVRLGLVLGDVQSPVVLARLASAVRGVGSARLVAAAAVGPEPKYAAAIPSGWGLRKHARWQDVAAARDVDAVVIAAPLTYRGAIVLAVLASGKDVYVLPPVSPSVFEAVRIRDAADQTGRIVQVGAELCGHHASRLARTKVAANELGRLRRVSVQFHHDAGRPMLDSLCDALTPLLYATNAGLPERVVSVGGREDGDPGKDPEMIMTTAEYGQRSHVVTATSSTLPGVRSAIRGDVDAIKIDANSGDDAQYGLLTEWLQALHSRRPCSSGPGIAVRSLSIASAAIEAHIQRRPMYPAQTLAG